MASHDGEKATTASPAQEVTAPTPEPVTDNVLPASWKYKSTNIAGVRFPWYASPESQLILVSFVCFLCPGMFNALNGLGGGGQQSAQVGDATNTALYSTFAVIGFFAGTITNRVGVRYAMLFSGLGYSIYVSSYLAYNYTQNFGYCVFAGALLGLCAGILWSAQGVIMMSYPPERLKGAYIAVFWVIFNLGGVIGALVPLGQNIHVTNNKPVSNGTYIGFLVLTFCGALLAGTLADGNSVIRRDGTKVILMKNPSWQSEIFGLWETLMSDPYVILLFPMFFASNWFYTYQFNDVNLAKFDTRTRALNTVLYWGSQMVGAAIFGFLLDLPKFRRTTRAKGAWIALFVLTFAIWGGGYAFQKKYTRAEVNAGVTKENPNGTFVKMDWTTDGYVGPMFLYIFYGMFDAIWQTCVYWFMGAITNNGRKLANFAGFYKGIQSAGAAIIWRLDGLNSPPPYMNLFASCWALLAGGLLFALPVVLFKIKDTVPIDQDLKFTDETLDDVIIHHKAGEGEVA